ncbi:MAG: CarD family transcriptional regulator [Pseudomonadota bacterium]|nr:CarD family transcriptional regulator [Pseudomonadota bacterium]|tara:strand:- start:512 stop:1318 length:807 start_codon:yes stop_codon:yes gene_type:complete
MSVKKKTQKAKPKKTANNPKKKAVKKTATKKIITKKSSPKKATPKKVATKKASPKKVATKKSTPKKATPKKVVSKKAASNKTVPEKVDKKKAISKKEQFLPEQYVIYPSHGIGQILEIEKKEIAGQMLKMYVIEFEKEKMILRVPIEKTKEIGVRKVSTKNQLKEIFEILTGKAKIRRTMWSRRAQEYEAKINSGDIKLLTEVVRDLFRSDSQPEQSYSERQLYEAARERLSREVAVIEKTDEQKAVEKMETILNNSNGRNEEINTED